MNKKYIETSAGRRSVDGWVEQTRMMPDGEVSFKVAFEMKTGYVRLTRQIQQQIDADKFLLQNGHAQKVVWVIRPSLLGRPPKLDPRVEKQLREAGIKWEFVK